MIRQIIGLAVMGIGAGILLAAVSFFFSNRKEGKPTYQKKGLEPLHPVHHWENQKRKNGKFVKGSK